jgi:hypothetical protein
MEKGEVSTSMPGSTSSSGSDYIPRIKTTITRK